MKTSLINKRKEPQFFLGKDAWKEIHFWELGFCPACLGVLLLARPFAFCLALLSCLTCCGKSVLPAPTRASLLSSPRPWRPGSRTLFLGLLGSFHVSDSLTIDPLLSPLLQHLIRIKAPFPTFAFKSLPYLAPTYHNQLLIFSHKPWNI